ncbi:MAG: GHKL domain-containing protein, partial [Chloroflexi bacterium]|nr:GHKL domain-containing protein [Chloroflexota bacterium]
AGVVDEIQMVQLLQNLIGNAIKFRSESTPQIHISCKADKGEWIISVKDNGIGIPHEYHDQVFVIFKRLHSVTQYPGSGIGMAIAARIVDRHGGKLWVESEPGEGSTFYFTIPKK